MYVAGDTLNCEVALYYLVDADIGDSLLAYITDLEQCLAQAEKVVEAAKELIEYQLNHGSSYGPLFYALEFALAEKVALAALEDTE